MLRLFKNLEGSRIEHFKEWGRTKDILCQGNFNRITLFHHCRPIQKGATLPTRQSPMEGARPKSSLQCQFSNCQEIFPSLEDLEKHEVGVHGVVRPFYPMDTHIGVCKSKPLALSIHVKLGEGRLWPFTSI